jgi:hypothetical protein
MAMALWLAACGAPVPPWSAPPAAALDLRVSGLPEAAELLTPVHLQLDLYRRADLVVEFRPELPAADFAVQAEPAVEVPFGDGFWQRTVLEIVPLRGPGELTIPVFTARTADGAVVATTAELRLRVVGALGAGDSPIEAPAGLLDLPRPLWWYAAIAGGLALAGCGCLGLLRRRTVAPPAAVALPAHVRALRALGRLRTAPRTTPAEIERFYVDVSTVLREYLEERFALRAPERTTEEFLRELEGGDRLAREHRAALEQFLRRCDLVKFAAQVPGEAEHVATFAIAEAFVEGTRTDLRVEVGG